MTFARDTSALHRRPLREGSAVPVGKAVRSLPELVAEKVIEEIMSGQLKPGDRLKELALSQEQAVSRTTVREALAILERWRFVERIPRAGARVIGFGEEDVAAQYEIRSALLRLAAARCARARDHKLLAQLDRLASEMSRVAAAEDADPDEFALLSIEAAQLLLQESGNRYLQDVYGYITSMTVSRMVRGHSLSFRTAARRRESAQGWQAIARAIGEGDAGAAEAATDKLVVASASGVAAALKAGEPGTAQS